MSNSPERARRAIQTVLVTALAWAIGTAAPAAAFGPPASTTNRSGQAVNYRGLVVEAPAGWQVIDLDQAPATCVRFDQPTVYLGHAGDQSGCAGPRTGGAPALQVEPWDAVSAERVPAYAATTARTSDLPLPEFVGGDAVLVVEAAGVVVTAHAGPSDESVVRAILAAATVTDAARPSLDAPTHPAAKSDAVVVPGSFEGVGLDACTAPSPSAMDAWLASPFRAVGVYIGGVTRACGQPNLTASWVNDRVASGWTIVPTFVGLQAPCTGFAHRMSSDQATARSQGAGEASDAAQLAGALSIGAGSAIYNDIEAYDTSAPGCSNAVRSYVDGWTDRLHELGYLSGVYSSAASGISDLAASYGSPTQTSPDHIWFAWWNGVADTDAGPYVPDSAWAGGQRIHQYRGDHNETHGGVTINIDSNALDVGAGEPPPPPPPDCADLLDFPSYPLIREGSTGDRVVAAQCRLEELGFDPGAIDGDFGPGTTAAARQFQQSVGLSADGIIGPGTWTALLSAGPTPLLQQGSTGDDVRRVQRALTAALGRTVGIDGQFGSGTAQAVRDYQTNRGLGVDGKVGPATWAALQRGA